MWFPADDYLDLPMDSLWNSLAAANCTSHVPVVSTRLNIFKHHPQFDPPLHSQGAPPFSVSRYIRYVGLKDGEACIQTWVCHWISWDLKGDQITHDGAICLFLSCGCLSVYHNSANNYRKSTHYTVCWVFIRFPHSLNMLGLLFPIPSPTFTSQQPPKYVKHI